MEIRTIAGLTLAGAIALAGAWHLYQDHERTVELATTTTRLNQALQSNRTLQGVNDNLAEQVRISNAAVAALKAQADARAAVGKAASASAAVVAKKQYASAAQLLKRPQSVPGDACKSADALLTETIKGRS